MQQRIHHIPDSGDPFLLVVPEQDNAATLELGLFVSACDAPLRECPCLDTTIFLRSASALEHADEDAEVAFDIDTREITVDSDPAGLLTGRERWLRGLLQGDLGSLIAARVRRRKRAEDAYREVDWSRYRRGDLIALHEAHPRELDIIVQVNGRRYWLCDEYCVEPQCDCQEVVFQVMNMGVAGQNEGIIRADLKQRLLVDAPIALRPIWDAAVTKYGWDLLRDRRVKIRKVAKHVSAQMRSHEEPAQAPTRPGRNDPCLCGSGKKYKKCCALSAN